MAYSKKFVHKPVTFLRIKVKIGKWLAKRFPYYKIRVLGIKLCGFTAGTDVYIAEDLIIASVLSEKSCNLHIGKYRTSK